jgi:glycosyltransferase involved in cell wall biosynthesis
VVLTEVSLTEVSLADAASESAENAAELDRHARTFREKGWKVIREAKRSAGAARNAAAAAANGDYLLFMDADDYAKPDEISTFATAAMHGGADVLSCFIDRFAGDDTPANGEYVGRATFLGAAIAPGLFYNRFGSGNFLIRREAFERLGGFAEESIQESTADYGLGGDDWEFLGASRLRDCVWKHCRERSRGIAYGTRRLRRRLLGNMQAGCARCGLIAKYYRPRLRMSFLTRRASSRGSSERRCRYRTNCAVRALRSRTSLPSPRPARMVRATTHPATAINRSTTKICAG